LTRSRARAPLDGVRTGAQAVTLAAPDPRAAARFYADWLGCRIVSAGADGVVLDAYGREVVLSRGPGAGHRRAPPGDQAALSLHVEMGRMESIWELDRRRDPTVPAPLLDARGLFVYVTLDPAGNAVALLARLPSLADDGLGGRVTKRLSRPDFD
jgi:catechol 2,3-dioxygenase-like lactoylglutathione lyase family enzyme